MKNALTILLGSLLYIAESFIVFAFISLEVGGISSAGYSKPNYFDNALLIIVLGGTVIGLCAFIIDAMVTKVAKGKWFLVPPVLAVLVFIIDSLSIFQQRF